MANPELGAKQVCPACSAKFYDLNRRPAACPKCGETFDPEEAVRSRRVRARTVTPEYEADEEKEEAPVKKKETDDDFEDEPDDTPEIDQAVEADPVETDDDTDVEPGAPKAPPDDIGVDFASDEESSDDDDDDAVPFIEDEDEDFPEDEIEGLPGDGEEDR